MSRTISTRSLALAAAALALGLGARTSAQAPPPTPRPLRVIVFEGGQNLPIWAAQRQGFFEANGVAVALTYTPNSVFFMERLFDGTQDLGFAAIDNVVAYQEGQGESPKVPPNPDFFAFMSGDDGLLTWVTAPPIKAPADARGKTMSVDAMTTGYAFALRELIQKSGLGDSDVKYERAGGTGNRFRDLMAGKHDGTILRTPFELAAEDRGFHVLATGAKLGPYVGSVGVARRSWARANEAALVGFIRGYGEGLRWLQDPKNREIGEALLVANMRAMTPSLAKRSYDVLFAPGGGGLIRDMGLDPARVRTVLALRSKYGQPKGLDDPSKYVDTTYLQKALAGGAPSAASSKP